MNAEACTTMLEDCKLSTLAHLGGSSTQTISSHNTSFSSPPSSLSPLEIKQEAQYICNELDSRLDDLKTQKDEISSSFFHSTSSSIDTSADDSILTLDPAHENLEQDSPLPFSTLRVYRRLQQQLNSQLLCTHSQVRRISDLVEEMVEEMISENSQCSTKEPSTRLAPVEPAESSAPQSHIFVLPGLEADDRIEPDDNMDEGFCEGNEVEGGEIDTHALLVSLRRASAQAVMRRSCIQGKGVVFAPPRMRRKILKRKRREQPDTGT